MSAATKGNGPDRSSSESAWAAVVDSSRDAHGRIDQGEFISNLADMVAREYQHTCPSAQLLDFTHGPAIYLFDGSGNPQADRTVLAVAHPEPPTAERDAGYQRGYPLPDNLGGRPVDRGHFVPYSSGGLFGPNLFVQDRALNRGWSSDGRDYRQLERAAVTDTATTLFVRPLYTDDSDIPEFLDLGVVVGSDLKVQRFRNRFDTVDAQSKSALEIHLGGATDAQIGALGEQTAAVLLEETLDATIVAMGDAGMPREEGRQDLDLLAIVDGELYVYEVKTRFMSKVAGRRTRAGDLPRPRLRRPSSPSGTRQGSQNYVAARLTAYIDTGGDYEGVDVRVMAIDFRAMLAQQFAVNDTGTRLSPLSRPVDCTEAAHQALLQILDHRGHL